MVNGVSPIIFPLTQKFDLLNYLGQPPFSAGTLPFAIPQTLYISGYTKDSAGNIVTNAQVFLYRTIDNSFVEQVTSDGTGYYLFSPVGGGEVYYVRAYKAGSPDIFGTTVNTLQGKPTVAAVFNPPFVQYSIFASTVNSASNSITLPSPPQVGHLLILVVNGGNTFNVPGGWTKDSTLVNNSETTIFRKISDGSEQTVVTTMTGSSKCNLIYFELPSFTTLDKSSTGTAGAGATQISPGTTATTTAAVEIVIAAIGFSNGAHLNLAPFTWSNNFVQYLYSMVDDSASNLELAVSMLLVFNTGAFTSTATLTKAIPVGETANALIVTYK